MSTTWQFLSASYLQPLQSTDPRSRENVQAETAQIEINWQNVAEVIDKDIDPGRMESVTCLKLK